MIRFVLLAIAITAVHCQYGYHHQPEYKEHKAPEYKEHKAPEYKEHNAPEYKEHKEPEYYDAPHYSFEYSVHDEKTGDIKSQKEQREGDHTQGEYSLVEPDGSLRSVKYNVEGYSGFVADVHKEEGKYNPAPEPSHHKPEPSYYKPAPQPSYHKSEPSYYKPAPQPSYHKSEPSYYKPAPQPSYHKSEPSYYKPAPKPGYY